MDDHPTDFYAFYNRVLRPEIVRIEPLRRETLTYFWVITILTLVGIVIWYVAVSRLFETDSVSFYSCIVPAGVGIAAWSKKWSAYRDAYQLKLVAAIVHQYNASFAYDRDDGVGEAAIIDCGLFPRYLGDDDRHCKGADRVSGTIGQTPFEFSDLDVSVGSGKQTRQLFKGVFFVADFNKNFSGETFVTSRHAWLRGPETPPGEVVKLEDPQFEAAFATHSSSQIEARYILSPALMSRIVHFGQQSKAPIAISFSGTSMFIAIFGGSTRLEPVLWQTLQKPSLFFGIWANLEFLCGIVNEMDLNTRIWTKDAPPRPPSAPAFPGMPEATNAAQ